MRPYVQCRLGFSHPRIMLLVAEYERGKISTRQRSVRMKKMTVVFGMTHRKPLYSPWRAMSPTRCDLTP